MPFLAVLIAANLATHDPAQAAPVYITNERGSAILFAPPPGRTAEYVRNRHALLEDLANRQPADVIEAQVSLAGLLPVTELPEFVKGIDLTFLVLNLGGDHPGGFHFREGESLNEGVSRLLGYHDDFLEFREEPPAIPQVFGFRVLSTAEDLVALRDNEHVGLVDPLWDEFSDAAGTDVRKLAAPLPLRDQDVNR